MPVDMETRVQRMLEKAKQWRVSKYKGMTASKMQEAIRAEAGLFTESHRVVRDNEIVWTSEPVGMVTCVTCGAIGPWKGKGEQSWGTIHAGHFIPQRRNSILFDERQVHCQCAGCNKAGGNPSAYEVFMREVYGQDVIDDLRRIHNQEQKSFTHEELVRMRIWYMDRTKAAVKKMKGET